MGILYAILIGFLIGLIAKVLMPGRDPGGFIITALLGIGGAVVGHWIGTAFGFYHANEPGGLVTSIVGAMLLLLFYRLTFGRHLPH